MRKYKWAIIAGVCVLALLIVVAAIFIPRLFRNPALPPSIPESREIVIPAHWWQASLTEQQLEVLRSLWGTEITVPQFLEAIWPTVLDEMPADVAAFVGDDAMKWTYESFEEWTQIQKMFFGHGRLPEEGATAMNVVFYPGRRDQERDTTFIVRKGNGIVPENCYRISLYTDDVLVCPW